MTQFNAEATPVDITWGGVENEYYDGYGDARAATFHPVRLIVELPARDLTGLDLTKPITISQEEP